MYRQWGKIQKTFFGYKQHENITIKFPIAFSQPPKIQQTYYFNDKWDYDTDYFNMIYSVTSKNYKTWVGGADGIHWFAIGY